MDIIKMLTFVVVLLPMAAYIEAQCTLPAAWSAQGSTFYAGYAAGKPVILGIGSGGADKWAILTGGTSSTCTSVDENIGNYSTVAFKQDTTGNYFCREVIMAPNTMFTRRTPETRFRTDPYNISECEQILGKRTQFKAFVLFPTTASTWKPFGPPNGVYKFAMANYTVSLGDATQCVDAAATLTVASTKWTFSSTCVSGTQSYRNPFAGELTVVSGLPDSQLSVDGSSSTSGMILLAVPFTDVSGVQYQFIIARYLVVVHTDSSSSLNLFFTVGNPMDPIGYVSTDFVPNTEKPTLLFMNLTSSECTTTSVTCNNGGSCVQGWLTTSCACAAGYEGATCDTNKDDCTPNPCDNGGTCKDGVNTYTCECATGFGGLTCKYVDQCSQSPCQNNGTCFTSKGNYRCECPDDYVGRDCEIRDFCHGKNPCNNGGTCYFKKDDFYCFCPFGFSGKTCDVNNGTGCTDDTCKNMGVCRTTPIGFFCECPIYYDGDYCENLSDWFIVALVLAALLLLVLLISLIVCCCFCCCGWRPNNASYNSMNNSESSLKVDQAPGTVEFNFSPASPYYGIQMLGSK